MIDTKDGLLLAALGAELSLKFVTAQQVIDLHDYSIEHFGGNAGVRDAAMLESAVARQLQTAVYESSDAFDVAASLAYGVCQNHAFLDGNKRSAYLAMQKFLGLNGLSLTVDPVESYNTFVGIAAGDITEPDLALWISRHTNPQSDHWQPESRQIGPGLKP